MNVLILCTGNSCRSQMAHGFLKSFDSNINVYSAGTEASGQLNQTAVSVMNEIGIDISEHTSDSVEKYLDKEWDFVITVCGGANEACPAFIGKVKKRLHKGFDDPSHAIGDKDFIISEFYRVREEIKEQFLNFYLNEIRPQLNECSKFLNSGNIVNGVLSFSGSKTIMLCENNYACLVDIRDEYDTASKQFGVNNIIYLANAELSEKYSDLPKDKLLILADSTGHRNKEALEFLQEKGYHNLSILSGGIVDWEKNGHKIIKDPNEVITGQCACKLGSTNRKINYK